MKKFAADNLLFLRKYYSDVYHFVRNRTYNHDQIQLVESQSKHANLVLKDSEQREIILYSRYDPMIEAERWVRTVEAQYQEFDNIFFIGLGLGYHLQAFINHFPDKKVYLYEPDPDIFMAAIESVDLAPLLKNQQVVYFGVGTGQAFQREIVQTIFNDLISSCELLVIPSYRRTHAATIDELMSVIKTVSRGYRSNIKAMYRFQVPWAENIILNLERVLRSPSFRSLRGVGRGVPAIIVGSGPSLAMESEWLKQLKNRSIIIAAGSSVQGLLHLGIEPDLIVSMDPTPANQKVFDNVDISHIPFLFIPTIRHTILDREWQHLLHAYFNNDALSRYYMDLDQQDPIFTMNPTVTGTAVQAAVYMQCSQIFFIGQDFSFPNDQHYAEGVKHVSENVLNRVVNKADLLVENVNGGMNRTDNHMLLLKESVENILSGYRQLEFYNASRVGAVIRHTQAKTLDSLYEECQHEVYPQGFISYIQDRLELYPDARIDKALKKIENSKLIIYELTQYVEELKSLVEQSSRYQKNGQRNIQKWFDRFNTTWNNLDDNDYFKRIYRFLLYAEYDYVRRNWNHILAEKDLVQQMNKLAGCILPIISGFYKVTPVLLTNIEEVMHRIHLKRSETA
jgi:hypothetical protein